jgi:nitroreductase
MEAVLSRQTIRDYADKEIPRDVLTRLVDAARRAPSARNGQPWRFVVFTGARLLGFLGATGVDGGASHIASARAAIGLVCRRPQEHGDASRVAFDVGQAAMSIQLTATALGLGCGLARVGEVGQVRLAQSLKLDSGTWAMGYLIALGYPTRPLRVVVEPDRLPLDDVTTWVDEAIG